MLSAAIYPDLALPRVNIGMISTATIFCTEPQDVENLAALQQIVFPTLHPTEYITAEQYLNHLRVFPEGQYVARLGNRAIASTTTLRINFDFKHGEHNFVQISDNGWLNDHDPCGEWLYGIDVSVHPAFQRRGIGSQLYSVRTELVERLRLRGQVTGGMLPGYPAYAHLMSVEAYCWKVVNNELTDPTLTPQLRNGFRFVQVLPDYLMHVDGTYSAAALIVKENRRL